MKILLVDDDEFLSELLTQSLAAYRYVVDTVRDGETGWTYGTTFDYDLIVLDVMLPKLDGITLCQRFRTEGYTTPILLLTAQDSSTAKVRGLDAGADDYVVKPFDIAELCARIRALLRRSSTSPLPLLTWAGLLLNPSNCEVTYSGQPLTLTTKEYELLEMMMRESHHVFSTPEILGRLWSSEEYPSEATVRSHIRRVRHKLVSVGAPSDLISTVHGRGYYLKPEDEIQQSPNRQSSDREALPEGYRPCPDQAQYLAFLNQTWLTQKPKILAQLATFEAAIASQCPPDQAHQVAHKLAGTLGTFGLTQAMTLARQLEQGFDRNAPPPSPEHLTALYHALQQEIVRWEAIDGEAVENLGNSPSNPATLPKVMPKVMIVDDDDHWLQTLPHLLQPWGFKITTLAEPQQFWTVLKAVNPDLLVLDINMPEMNGFDLCEALRRDSHWQRLPVLFLTGLTDMTTQNRAFTIGADDYLCKPVLGIDLANRILNRLQRVRTWAR
jgi:DNA-binding response OmpR family regulator